VVQGVTTAADVKNNILKPEHQFKAEPAEGGMGGKIIPPSGSTGSTGSDGNFANVTVRVDGANNDITFTATTAGDAFNEVTVSYVFGTSEATDYDPSAKILTITVVPGETTAAKVIDLMETIHEFTTTPAERGTGIITPHTPAGKGKSTRWTGSDANVGRVVVKVPGKNNDLRFVATRPGPGFNGLTVKYVHGAVPGAVYDAITTTLTITVKSGETTAADVITLMQTVLQFKAEAVEADDDGVIYTLIGKTEISPQALFPGSDPHDDLLFLAKTPDPQYDGKTITLKSEPGISETIEIDYNETDKSLTVKLKNNTITAAMVRDAVNGDSGIPYRAILDTRTDTQNNGTGKVVAAEKTTSMDPVADKRAGTTVFSAGADNDLAFTAPPGTQYNNATVEYVEALGAIPPVTVNYNPETSKLTIPITHGVTTAAQVMDLVNSYAQLNEKFTVTPAEGGTTGLIRMPSGSTGGTGGVVDTSLQQGDKRQWISLKASVGQAQFVGFDDITIRAENLMVAVNSGFGKIVPVSETAPHIPNTWVVNYEAKPLLVKTGTGKKAHVLISIPGPNNDLFIQAAEESTDYNHVTVEFLDSGADEPSAAYIDDATVGVINLLSSGSTGSTGVDDGPGGIPAGVEAHTTIRNPGPNNDLTFTATTAGVEFNDVTVEYVDSQGAEPSALWDPGTKKLTIHIKSGVTTAAEVITLLEGIPEFTAIAAEDATKKVTIRVKDGITTADQVITLLEGVPEFTAIAAEGATNGVIHLLSSGTTGMTGIDEGMAHAVLAMNGDDNDLFFVAKTPEPQYDGNEISLEIDNGISGNVDTGLPFAVLLDATTDTGNDGSGTVVDANGTTSPIAAAVHASALVVTPGDDNDLTFTATTPGTQYNDVTVEYVEGLEEVAVYTEEGTTKRLTITIIPGVTTAQTVITLLEEVDEFEAVGAEGDTSGLITTLTGSTGGTGESATIKFDFPGSGGELLEAAGHLTIDVMGFVYFSGGFALTKKTETVKLANTVTGVVEPLETRVDVLTIGASKINAFVGVNGPYWTDLDGSGDLSWANTAGETLDPAVADTNHDGIVDPDESAELSDKAVGFSLSNANLALAMMKPHPPPPSLAPVLVARPNVTLTSPGLNNDLTFTAAESGPKLNDVTVEYVHGLEAAAVYNSGQKKLTITIVPGVTTGDEVITLMDGVPEFTASPAEGVASGVIDTAPASTAFSPQVLFPGPGSHDDLLFVAKTAEPQFDGNEISLEIDNGISGNVDAAYDAANKILTVKVKNNTVTAAMVRDAVNADANLPFAVLLDTTTDTDNNGSGSVVPVVPNPTTSMVPDSEKRASVTVFSPGPNNDLTFIAMAAGTNFSDVTVKYINGAKGEKPKAVYSPDDPKTLTITVVPGVTTAADIIYALDLDEDKVDEFTAVAAEGGVPTGRSTRPPVQPKRPATPWMRRNMPGSPSLFRAPIMISPSSPPPPAWHSMM